MLYLLDSNVLITANNSYYPIDRVPEYWDWILEMAKTGKVKMPIELFEEIKEGPDDDEKDILFAWIQSTEIRGALLSSAEVDADLVQKVVYEGYAPDLKDDEIEQLGRDPFLIAHGMSIQDSCIVTTEVSAPSKKRQNRKVPDVCAQFSVRWCDPFNFIRALGFSTSWKKPK
jgi:hypothetical protein